MLAHNDANLQKAISMNCAQAVGFGGARRLSRRCGARAGDRLRQGIEDRALRDGQRPDAEGRRAEARLRHGEEFDRVVDPAKMVKPYVAGSGPRRSREAGEAVTNSGANQRHMPFARVALPFSTVQPRGVRCFGRRPRSHIARAPGVLFANGQTTGKGRWWPWSSLLKRWVFELPCFHGGAN